MLTDWWGYCWMILAEKRGLLTPENRAAARAAIEEKYLAAPNVIGLALETTQAASAANIATIPNTGAMARPQAEINADTPEEKLLKALGVPLNTPNSSNAPSVAAPATTTLTQRHQALQTHPFYRNHALSSHKSPSSPLHPNVNYNH